MEWLLESCLGKYPHVSLLNDELKEVFFSVTPLGLGSTNKFSVLITKEQVHIRKNS